MGLRSESPHIQKSLLLPCPWGAAPMCCHPITSITSFSSYELCALLLWRGHINPCPSLDVQKIMQYPQLDCYIS